MRDETAGKRVETSGAAITSQPRGASVVAPSPALDLVLGTINAPRPVPIDGPTLVCCLRSSAPIPQWKPHIEALFDEVSIEAVHHVVLTGVVGFEDLRRAARTWGITGGRNVDWVQEMADYSLGASAPIVH